MARTREQYLAYQRAYAAAHREQAKARTVAWRAANPDRAKASVKRCWADPIRRAKYNAKKAAAGPHRYQERLKRAPVWLTEFDWWAMQEAYDLARVRSEVTGIKHEVDHVVPLFGERVSGLHVPQNLRVIPKAVNRSKGNAYVIA